MSVFRVRHAGRKPRPAKIANKATSKNHSAIATDCDHLDPDLNPSGPTMLRVASPDIVFPFIIAALR